MDIFNHYVENSFAAYPESKLPDQSFDTLVKMSAGLPTGIIKDCTGEIRGFGMLRPYSLMTSFACTAEVSCFIHPAHTGKGLGKKLLTYLEKEGRRIGIKNVLANISSLNPGSIKFHQINGFVECGRFQKIGRKRGREFDVVWLQKKLQKN